MSHELTIRADQSAEMAYTGDTPWHGLGQKLTTGASIEEWQRAAGMDWRIKRAEVQYATGPDNFQPRRMPEQHVLFRGDTKTPLGVVSSRYNVVQPYEVLEFFRDLVAQAGFKLSTAGTMFGGRKFWALADVGESNFILPGDWVRGNLLLATSCDGSSPTLGKYVATRVVCNNTMTIALGEKGGRAIKLSHRSEFDAEAMKDSLGIMHGQFSRFIAQARQLAGVSVDVEPAREFVRGLLMGVEKPEMSASARAPKGEAEILRLFGGAAMGDSIERVHGTAWGLLNAVTEYVDHAKTAKTDSHRLDSAWFNGGDAMKSQALELLLARV